MYLIAKTEVSSGDDFMGFLFWVVLAIIIIYFAYLSYGGSGKK